MTNILKTILLKLFLGFIIYFGAINIVTYFIIGIKFTPTEWLLNPFYILSIELYAWIILIMCEVYVYYFAVVVKK